MKYLIIVLSVFLSGCATTVKKANISDFAGEYSPIGSYFAGYTITLNSNQTYILESFSCTPDDIDPPTQGLYTFDNGEITLHFENSSPQKWILKKKLGKYFIVYEKALKEKGLFTGFSDFDIFERNSD